MSAETIEQATLTVDLALFARDNAIGPKQHVLLINGKFGWALPGGKVRAGEEVYAALEREVEEETGVRLALMLPVGVFSKVGRDHRGRYVSFAYQATLATTGQIEICAGSDAKEVRWWPLDSLPQLAFDHKEIIETALGGLL